MKITEFWAENFRTIEGRQSLPLTYDTINLITATNNGRGKSSWIYCFYFLVCNHTIDTIKAYTNWNYKTMSCGITFEYLGKIFKIEYYYDDGTSKKTLDLDGETFNTPTSTNKKLREFFEPSIFLNATALFQGTKNFVSVKDSERRGNLQQVFNLDYSQEIKDIEKEEKEVQEKELAPKEKELIICASKTFPIKELIQQKVADQDFTRAEDAVQDLKKLQVETLVKVEGIEKQKKDKAILEAKLTLESASLESNKTQLSKLENEFNTLKAFTQNFSILEGLKTKLSSITLERVKTYDETELNRLRQNVADATADLKVLQKKLIDCKSGKCPTCQKDFESSDIKSSEIKIKFTNGIIETLQQELTKCVAEQTSYQEKVKLNESKKRDKELYESKISSEEARLAQELITNCQLTDRKALEIKQKKDIISSQELVVQELVKNISLIEIPHISDLNDILDDTKIKLEELEQLIREYNSIGTQNELIEKQNKENVELEKQNIDKLTSLQEDIDKLIEKKAQLTKMRFFLKKEFPSYVISSMIKQIEMDMNEFIDKVYYKSLDVEIIGDDDKISVLYGTGQEKIDCTNASGAEEKLLSMSFCYSLNKLKHYDILLLDEIDESMTEENAIKLAEKINIIQEDYDFIGVVSHVNAVKDYYNIIGANIIEVDKDERCLVASNFRRL